MRTLIRAANGSDVPKVRELAQRWARDEQPRGYVPAPEELLGQFVGQCFFVAETNDEVIGYAYGIIKTNQGAVSAVIPDEQRYLEIEDLYVTAAHRSAGIGAQLVDAVTDLAGREKIRFLMAYSSTRDVDGVLRFYRSRGFASWSVQMFRDLGE